MAFIWRVVCACHGDTCPGSPATPKVRFWLAAAYPGARPCSTPRCAGLRRRVHHFPHPPEFECFCLPCHACAGESFPSHVWRGFKDAGGKKGGVPAGTRDGPCRGPE